MFDMQASFLSAVAKYRSGASSTKKGKQNPSRSSGAAE
jgi:hypothetical protein